MTLYSIRFMAGRKMVEWQRWGENRRQVIESTMKAAIQEYPAADFFKLLQITEVKTQ